jgi:hypothetical protein
VLLFFVVLIYTSLDSISSSIANFSLDTIVESARITYVYLTQEGFAESRYTLGEFDASAGGILKLVPAGINVTLFRPYLWEANKPVTLIAALESLITLILTLYIVLKVGVFNVFRKINNHPIILFCIFFAIIFSLSVGITSGNFGTLMRYKIPMMPFYFTALVLIYKLPTNKFSAS